MAELTIRPAFVVNEKGEKKAVILDYKRYRELMEEIEDLRDVGTREKEPVRSFEAYHKERMQKK